MEKLSFGPRKLTSQMTKSVRITTLRYIVIEPLLRKAGAHEGTTYHEKKDGDEESVLGMLSSRR